MNIRRRVTALCAVGAAVAAAASAPAGAAGAGVRLGEIVRVTTPGDSRCPVEGEPDVVVTAAGTWVGYNDFFECLHTAVTGGMSRLTSLQLLPARGGPPRYVAGLRPAKDGEYLAGDPALAPDPRTGGVVLATLYSNGASDTSIEVFRVTPSLRVTRLPSPKRHPHGSNVDDKEFIASDANPRSRYYGRLYLAWDDFSTVETVFRAFDGRRWLPAVRIGDIGKPDVAVAPNGDVAVAYEVPEGVAVRVSADGGRSFGKPAVVIDGGEPGRTDPSCPLRATVGTRQRTTKGVRAAYDAAGRLHVVAAVGPPVRPFPDLAGLRVGIGTGGVSDIAHAIGTGRSWRTTRLPKQGVTRFHPAVAPTPAGGVAVAWLETSDAAMTTYDAYLAAGARGAGTLGAPVRLSTAPATFPSATEAQLAANCYGIGDYLGVATTARGVVTVWPTTDDRTTPHVDSDLLVREAYLR